MEKLENLRTDEKMQLARQGRDQDLDVLVNDKSWFVRSAVAAQGRNQDLDILVNDKEIFVLYTVLRHKRLEDIKRSKERIQNGEFNHIQSEIDKNLLKEMKNIIKNNKNKAKELDDDWER